MNDSLLFSGSNFAATFVRNIDSLTLQLKNANDSLTCFVTPAGVYLKSTHDTLHLSAKAGSLAEKGKIIPELITLSDSLKDIVLLIFAATCLLVFSSNYIRPDIKIYKKFFYLLIPSWIFLGLSIYQNTQINNTRFDTFFQSKSLKEIFETYSSMGKLYRYQFNYFLSACACLILIAISHLYWWINSGPAFKKVDSPQTHENFLPQQQLRPESSSRINYQNNQTPST